MGITRSAAINSSLLDNLCSGKNCTADFKEPIGEINSLKYSEITKYRKLLYF